MQKLLISLLALIVLTFAGIAAFLTTFDANQYRDQIAAELSERTGRQIALNGPISLGLSEGGVNLVVLNATIGNPPWASRPVMASIGRFDLGVSLLPLLNHRIDITGLQIANADIELEAENGGRNNWDMAPAVAHQAETSEKTQGRSAARVSVHVHKLVIVNSRVTFYDREGSASVFKIGKMTIDGLIGAALHVEAEYNGAPLTLNLKTGARDLLPPAGAWPFSAGLIYGNYTVSVEGNIDLDAEKASLSSYEVKAGQSSVYGQLAVNWRDQVPVLRGTLMSNGIIPSDFKFVADPKPGAAQTAPVQAGPRPTRVFSDTPLALDILKAVNAAFDIKIGQIVLANGSLGQTTTTLNLQNGLLSIAPFETTLGDGAIDGQIKISAASPAQLSVILSSLNVEVGDIFRIAAMPAFMSGRSGFNMNLASTGDSPHQMASNAVGIINLSVAGGTILGSAASDVSSILMQVFAPKGSNALNCFAARFIVKNGVAWDNGILADTTQTTIAGGGNLDLGRETVDITLHAKTKQVNVGDLLPAAHVGGTFLNPRFSVDPTEVVQNVAGLLNSGGSSNNVPDLIMHEGRNPCVYTLEHPMPSTAGIESPPPDSLTGKAGAFMQKIDGLVKGLLGQPQ